MFPNAHSVYLHSTPSPELFSRTRRDFSHGCIRGEKPAELAAWALRENPKWDLAHLQAAMETGPNNFHVKLAEPIPVYILYSTALVEKMVKFISSRTSTGRMLL
jgi:murein L,D-transpeptidase YcbB/YkuD